MVYTVGHGKQGLHNDILQFTEDYTGCAVDGEGIAEGEVLDARNIDEWRAPEGPRGRVRATPVARGGEPAAVKCMYFTAMLLLGAAGVGGLRGQGRRGRGRWRRQRGEALVNLTMSGRTYLCLRKTQNGKKLNRYGCFYFK